MDYSTLGGSGGDYEYTLVRMDVEVAARGILSGARATKGGEYGQQIGFMMKDAKLVDGVLMENNNSGKLKVFGWDTLVNDDHVDLPDDYTADDAPAEYVESHPGGTSKYTLVDAVVGEDPMGDTDGMLPLGDIIVFESGGAKPSASAKLTAYSLGSRNGDEILKKDSVYGWLDQSFMLRPSLDGREVLYFKRWETPDGGNPFHKPNWVDIATKQNIIKGTTFNGNTVSQPSGEESGTAPAPAAPETPETPVAAPSAGAVEQFVSTMAEMKVTDANVIGQQIDVLVESENHPLSRDDVEAAGGLSGVRDAIMAKVA